MMVSHSVLIAIAAVASLPTSLAFNNPAGVDIWCGKAYRATNASFEPGGWLEDPPTSSVPLLDLKIRPRMSLYLDSDYVGSLLVDASVSYLVGQPFVTGNSTNTTEKIELTYHITSENPSLSTVLKGSVDVGSVNNEININLHQFPPSLDPYDISITASISRSNETIYSAKTQLLRLPSRTDGGSVTKLDNLHGGLSVLKGNETEFALIFPYTYYVQWSLYWYSNVSTLDEFAAMGYNVIHIVPTGDLADSPFPWDEFEPYLQRADELGLYLQWDVIWTPTNQTEMIEQVTRLRSHPSILLWYIADEPDGKSNPINSTGIGYEIIRSLDLYHPVSLALNCANFYYSDYAAGGEIIVSDVYPISTNTSWSTVYETPCNTTYGCCGCDNCHGAFEDISGRLDSLAHLDDLIGWEKTHWSAPQAFGNETFWTRYPTAAEEVVMIMISINHAAKGLVMWDFPTTSEILNITNKLAAIITADEMADFLLGAPLSQTLGIQGATRIDAAAWVGEKQMLLSVINLNYGDLEGNISVELPEGVKTESLSKKLWGDAEWKIEGSSISTAGMLGLETSLLVIDLS